MCGQSIVINSRLSEKMLNSLNNMILSASGWRKVFAASGGEHSMDNTVNIEDLCLVYNAAVSFSSYLLKNEAGIKTITVGRDSRPTGKILQDTVIKAFLQTQFKLNVLDYAAAPEIMCFARSVSSAFIYISASHNPAGHNGLKFGLNKGGVLDKEQSAELISMFREKCLEKGSAESAACSIKAVCNFDAFSSCINLCKMDSLAAYTEFSKEVIAGSNENSIKSAFFTRCKSEADKMKEEGKPLCITADFNGSARSSSIDKRFFAECGINLQVINGECGKIVHGILPEGENLRYCAEKIEELHKSGGAEFKNAILGYMPDCDGDRGNIVYWDETMQKAIPLEAQQVFALSVIAELAYLHYIEAADKPLAVAVNGPTSLRIEEIASFFKTKVFRAEVGEANVVNLAEKLRKKGFEVRILGEGSNGGNITYPSSVRDPINTVFAVLKFFLLKSSKEKKGLFEIWCHLSNQAAAYKPNFSLTDIIKTIPLYTTTAAAEKRAMLKIKNQDQAAVKRSYQKIFLSEWEKKKQEFFEQYGIISYKVFSTTGTEETADITDFGLSGRGGLKIQFYDKKNSPIAFIWMRGSGTEPIFRIMADIKGCSCKAETDLVLWQRSMVETADRETGVI